MGRTVALLKLAGLPVLIALVHSLVRWRLWMNDNSSRIEQDGALERFIVAGFFSQTMLALLLTVLVGLPFFRFCMRRGWDGLAVWLAGWLLVYALPLALTVSGWHPEAWLAHWVIILVLAALWWRLFYWEPKPKNA